MKAFRLRRAAVALALAAGLAAPAAAQTVPDYLDNRSTAETLIQSLYNAISRMEYARAWSYFADAPADTFEAYENGFTNTASVSVQIGNVSADCGAGTCNYGVPVILTSVDTGGTATVFTGCYVVRSLMAGAQTPPYRPLIIASGSLDVATGSPAFPTDCGQ